MKWSVLLLALCVAGCGENDRATQAPAVDEPLPASVETQVAPEPVLATATLHVVDLDGNPLPNLMPIATLRANAFDRPIATGGPTDANGLGQLEFPTGHSLYIRPWDPTFRYYSTNFFEVLPAMGTETKQLDFVMAKGATLRATIYLPTGEPASAAEVKIMLEHPTQGPWWPDHAATGASGHVEFPSLPPGEFTAQFSVEGVGAVGIPNVVLPPGGAKDLGAVGLLATN